MLRVVPPSIHHSSLRAHHFFSPVPLMYVLGDGVAQFFGLALGERARDGAAVLKAYDRDAAVHLEVEGEAAAVLKLEDERGRDACRAVGFKWHLCGLLRPFQKDSWIAVAARARSDFAGTVRTAA